MLHIYFGDSDSENYIFNPDIYFNNTYEDEWITDELSRQMIADVDGSEVMGPHLIESPFLGPIPPERLSGGVKTLILINQDQEHMFNASACGDNCALWILKIAEKKNITIRLGYLMNFGKKPFQAEIINLHRIVRSMGELDDVVIEHDLLRG